jgi:hypothetical protein
VHDVLFPKLNFGDSVQLGTKIIKSGTIFLAIAPNKRGTAHV